MAENHNSNKHKENNLHVEVLLHDLETPLTAHTTKKASILI